MKLKIVDTKLIDRVFKMYNKALGTNLDCTKTLSGITKELMPKLVQKLKETIDEIAKQNQAEDLPQQIHEVHPKQ
ncbi:MAG: hypothetical protein R3A45_01735 [Bdellovibrionota bacterium]